MYTRAWHFGGQIALVLVHPARPGMLLMHRLNCELGVFWYLSLLDLWRLPIRAADPSTPCSLKLLFIVTSIHIASYGVAYIYYNMHRAMDVLHATTYIPSLELQPSRTIYKVLHSCKCTPLWMVILQSIGYTANTHNCKMTTIWHRQAF